MTAPYSPKRDVSLSLHYLLDVIEEVTYHLDREEWLTCLGLLTAMSAYVEAATVVALWAAREEGETLADIAQELGVSKQAVSARLLAAERRIPTAD